MSKIVARLPKTWNGFPFAPFALSIVGISCGTGLIVGTAISHGQPILLLGLALLAGGYSQNIYLRRNLDRGQSEHAPRA
jgi:hypothetical protein